MMEDNNLYLEAVAAVRGLGAAAAQAAARDDHHSAKQHSDEARRIVRAAGRRARRGLDAEYKDAYRMTYRAIRSPRMIP